MVIAQSRSGCRTSLQDPEHWTLGTHGLVGSIRATVTQ